MKRLAIESKERLGLVESRITAIKLELAELEKEHELLSGLVKLYEGKGYDSITEERRVTSHMLKPGTRSLPSGYHSKDNLDDMVMLVMSDKEHALSTGAIHEAVKTLDSSVGYHSVSKTINRLYKAGRVKRAGKAYYFEEG